MLTKIETNRFPQNQPPHRRRARAPARHTQLVTIGGPDAEMAISRSRLVVTSQFRGQFDRVDQVASPVLTNSRGIQRHRRTR